MQDTAAMAKTVWLSTAMTKRAVCRGIHQSAIYRHATSDTRLDADVSSNHRHNEVPHICSMTHRLQSWSSRKEDTIEALAYDPEVLESE